MKFSKYIFIKTIIILCLICYIMYDVISHTRYHFEALSIYLKNKQKT
jgi:hypothetical protein